MIALANPLNAAIILVDNTGLPNPILTIDGEGPAGTFANSDPGFSANGVVSCCDTGNDRLFGDNGGNTQQAGNANVTYSFTGLAEGDYNIYATWLHDQQRVFQGVMTANGTFVDTFSGNSDGGANNIGGIDTTNGFVARKDASDDPSGSPFELIGVGTVGAGDGGTLNVVLTDQGLLRWDAVGIQSLAVASGTPEPTAMLLAVIGLVGVCMRRRSGGRG